MEIKPLPKMKIENFDHLFSIFINNWDKDKLALIKEVKALFINEHEQAIAICEVDISDTYLPINSKEKIEFDIKPVLEGAVKVNASSIVLAESCLPGDVYSDEHRAHLLQRFRTVAEGYNLKLTDFVSISTLSISSIRFQEEYTFV